MLTAFGGRFTPPLQRQTRPALRVRPYAGDTLWPLALAPVAPLPGMRGGGQQLVSQKRQGLFQGGCTELRERRAPLGEPPEPTAPGGPWVQRRLGPTTPLTQGVDLVPEHTQPGAVGPLTAEAPQQLAVGVAQVPLDAQIPRGEHRRALRLQPLVGVGCLRGRWRAPTPSTPFGLLGCQRPWRALATAPQTTLPPSAMR